MHSGLISTVSLKKKKLLEVEKELFLGLNIVMLKNYAMTFQSNPTLPRTEGYERKNEVNSLINRFSPCFNVIRQCC